jgi:UDP-N-acetylglucosamine 1-carboxyvinyltransferase
MVKSIRASYYLIGALLARFGHAEVELPGGCDFGYRPIDQHIKGFESLGAEIVIEQGLIKAAAKKLAANKIYFDVVSVGATINVMISAVYAEGVTILENVAKEPHVVDVANFLNAMGANIKGAGTDVIKIKGVDRLHGGVSHSIIPDQIEAGTFMIAAAATHGDVLVRNVIPKHMEPLSAKLAEMNVHLEIGDDTVRVKGNGPMRKASIKTLPYPGFPTDLHPQMAVLLSLCEGSSTITEGIWDLRFQYVDELNRMGARITTEDRTAFISGPVHFVGTRVNTTDLRAGAALVIAGLAAEGETEVDRVNLIDRGYESFVNKFRNLGAAIRRV